MKEKKKENCALQTRKLLKTKFCRRNLIKGINTGCIPSKLSGTILEIDKEGTQKMNQNTKGFVDDAQNFTRDDID